MSQHSGRDIRLLFPSRGPRRSLLLPWVSTLLREQLLFHLWLSYVLSVLIGCLSVGFAICLFLSVSLSVCASCLYMCQCANQMLHCMAVCPSVCLSIVCLYPSSPVTLLYVYLPVCVCLSIVCLSARLCLSLSASPSPLSPSLSQQVRPKTTPPFLRCFVAPLSFILPLSLIFMKLLPFPSP